MDDLMEEEVEEALDNFPEVLEVPVVKVKREMAKEGRAVDTSFMEISRGCFCLWVVSLDRSNPDRSKMVGWK